MSFDFSNPGVASPIGGFSPPSSPPSSPKSIKSRRVTLLAVSAVAMAVGVTAAVVFFAVPSVALSPVIAALAMVVGAIGFGILVSAAVVNYKRHKAQQSVPPKPTPFPNPNPIVPPKPNPSGSSTTQTTASNTATLNAQMEAKQLLANHTFGAKAFKVPAGSSMPRANPHAGEWVAFTARYPTLLSAMNEKAGHQTVQNLMQQAYYSGAIYAAADARYKGYTQTIMQWMGVIVSELVKGSPKAPTAQQTGIVRELADAFQSCQDEQVRTIEKVANKLNGGGAITSELQMLWHEYKMLKLDQFIGSRHPNCNKATSPSQQFPHIKSAYLVLFGQQFGLLGTDKAHLDTHKPTISDYNGSIANQFRKQLNLLEFAKEVALDINNVNADDVRLSKPDLIKWLTDTYPVGSVEGEEGQFGFHGDGKNYTDLVSLTDDHEYGMTPCISLKEVFYLLQNPALQIIV